LGPISLCQPVTHGTFIKQQKNDQYREGMWKIVACVGGACCPVALVKRLLDEGRYVFLGPGALIRSSVISGARQYIKREQPHYNTVLRWFKEAASVLGLDPDKYGGVVRLVRLRLRSPIAYLRNTTAGALSAPRTAMWSAVSRRVCQSRRTWDFNPAPRFLNLKLSKKKPGSPFFLQVCPAFSPISACLIPVERLCFHSSPSSI
jgi:hypothetical protein